MCNSTIQKFERELIQLLEKYNASIVSSNTTIRVFFWDEHGNIKDKIKVSAFNLKDK